MIRNERTLQLGEDHSSPRARMVSLHESFHAFLNSSTSFGNALMFASALAEIDEPGFGDLVDRLLGVAQDTHETYATLASVCASSRGHIDAEMLADYPAYGAYVERFLRAFGASRPALGVMALASCARVAMQTSLYEQLLTLPCERWLEVHPVPEQQPDWRFARLMTSEHASAAAVEVDAALARLGPPLSSLLDPMLDGPAALALLGRASARDVDLINLASYGVFANALQRWGIPAPDYDEQRRGLSEVVAKLEAYAGDRLLTSFSTPATAEEDVSSVMAEFQRERLVLRPAGDQAMFVDAAACAPGTFESFRGSFEGRDYLQFVAMPKAKALAMYLVRHGRSVLEAFPGEVVTGFRRRWVDPDAPPRVEFLLLPLAAVEAALASVAGAALLPVLSSSAIQVDGWLDDWQRRIGHLCSRCLVLVDSDPFALVDDLGADQALLRMSFARFRADATTQASMIEVLWIVSDDRPGAAFVLPCSAPLRDAVAAYAVRRRLNVVFDTSPLAQWRDMLTPAVSHLLREEPRFGDRFWLAAG